jgi:fido (protein-threonine AMPylation protein)
VQRIGPPRPGDVREVARPLTAADRERAAANALASTRAEGLDPAQVELLLAAWARGEIDTDQVVAAGLDIAAGQQQQSGAPPQAAETPRGGETAVVQDPYVCPGTTTLRNRYGVRDPAELARRETAASAVRLAERAAGPIPGTYDLAHLQAFNHRIFGDVYEWAGGIRTVAIVKGDDLFALPEHIDSYLGGGLAQLGDEQHLRDLDREPFIDRLAHYLAEINATHPCLCRVWDVKGVDGLGVVGRRAGGCVGALRGRGGVSADAQPYFGPRPGVATGRAHDV